MHTNTGRQTRQKLREPLQRVQWLYFIFIFFYTNTMCVCVCVFVFVCVCVCVCVRVCVYLQGPNAFLMVIHAAPVAILHFRAYLLYCHK